MKAEDTGVTGTPPVLDVPWDDTPSSDRLQKLVPGLRMVRLLGQGGMGLVYEAVREPSGERVAVKVIQPRVLAHPDAQARFRRETEVLARLFSPRVVRLLDHGQRDGWHYLVMEYLEGSDLRARLSAGPLPFPEGMAMLGAVVLSRKQVQIDEDAKLRQARRLHVETVHPGEAP